MAWSEHLGGNKYKIVERDPALAKMPKRSITVEMPEEIARSKSEKKRAAWLAVQEEDWSELVKSGEYKNKGKNRSKSKSKRKVTFADFIPTWKKVYAGPNMGGKTILNTMSIIESRLIPEFGDRWIDEITTLELAEWFADLKNLKSGKPLATNSKLNIYKAASSIFENAKEWKVIKENPMDGVKRPSQSKKEKKEMRSKKQAYNRAEVEKLLVALYALPNGWRLYFTGVMLGGFRRGEFLAVEWPDLDYDRCAIWIEKQITLDEEGNKIEGEVKTEESEGWVAMPKWYMDELRRYRKEWLKERFNAKNWQGGNKEYVFHGGNGVMYYPTTPTLTWGRFLKKNGLPHVKLHGLRHTAGMLLRESGTDLKTIQERLRHTKLDTTANIYTHKLEKINRAAADQLEDLNPKRLKIAP
ncbi:site-specific integrase [Paenibacillus woosongensis]|uniref:Site-specific integrase n=1 Tax=Paenibacillus woosongensis TaxID=307580 RepID=A0AA95IA07_9BACL|nr:site-specific integrase [Paenibacillus woosongensis]WHX50518.1 site-specific integrase [Paenibacillus woosongensis]